MDAWLPQAVSREAAEVNTHHLSMGILQNELAPGGRQTSEKPTGVHLPGLIPAKGESLLPWALLQMLIIN